MTPWEVVAILDHASDHIMDSCNELNEAWSDAYDEATQLLKQLANKARAKAYKAGK